MLTSSTPRGGAHAAHNIVSTADSEGTAMSSATFTNLIVSYNNRAQLPDLLRDLRQYAPGSSTIVIDNASPDKTADVVAAEFPEARLVRNPQNVGYARAVNQGFRMSTTPYVFLLNPDIRIRDGEVFGELHASLQEGACLAVAGPLQFKEGGRRPHLNFTWSYWTPRAFEIYMRYLLGAQPGPLQALRVSFLNAGCLFIRRSAFEAVGGLNEKYFLYGEEPDLFLKLMRFGFQCRLVPSAAVTHSREQSLRSVPSLRRLSFKLLGVRNIADAVVRGNLALLRDRLSGRRPPGSCRD